MGRRGPFLSAASTAEGTAAVPSALDSIWISLTYTGGAGGAGGTGGAGGAGSGGGGRGGGGRDEDDG